MHRSPSSASNPHQPRSLPSTSKPSGLVSEISVACRGGLDVNRGEGTAADLRLTGGSVPSLRFCFRFASDAGSISLSCSPERCTARSWPCGHILNPTLYKTVTSFFTCTY